MGQRRTAQNNVEYCGTAWIIRKQYEITWCNCNKTKLGHSCWSHVWETENTNVYTGVASGFQKTQNHENTYQNIRARYART